MKNNFLITLCSVILIHGVARAQDEKKVALFNNLYMGAEVGATKGYKNFFQGGLWLQADHHYFKIKAAVASDPATAAQKEFHKRYCKGDCSIDTRQLSDIGVLYGKTYRILKVCQVQAGAGLAYVSKMEEDDEFNRQKLAYEPEQYKARGTVGIPAELRFAIQFKRYFSISCSAHANVNPVKSFQGLSAGVALGLF